MALSVTWPRLGSAQPAPTAPPAEAHPSPPRLLHRIALDYPMAGQGIVADVALVVDVDAEGGVTGARVVAGPEVFHDAALQGAQRLTFAPALRGGVPVASAVRVSFHFAPPDPDPDLDQADIEIIVHAEDPDREDTQARTTLDAEAVERAAGSDLAETLTEVPGVVAARGTADAAKPIIRGHRERRLLVLFDGIRHEGQKWGPDHATEIDPFSAGEISVVRGAAGARYGPDAIGGVVLVVPPLMRSEPGVGGKAVAAYATNGRRPYGALRLDAGLSGAARGALRIEGNVGRGASVRTPDYVLGNTGSQAWNLGASASVGDPTRGLRVTWHHHDLRAGVFYGVQASTPEGFAAQLAADRPATADLWTTSTAIDRPYQAVSHDVASVRGATHGGWGAIEAVVALQINHRREFEQAREAVEGPQYDFLLRTTSIDVGYVPPEHYGSVASWTGIFGVQGQLQENVYQGLPLLPNYRSLSGGVSGVQRLSFARFDLEGGARVDRLARTAFLGRQDYDDHARRGTLDDQRCAVDADVARCPNTYDAGSLSLGGVAHLVPEVLDVKLDLSSASRFPNVDELYLIGTSPSFPVFAVGRPDLGVETSWGATTTLGLMLPWIQTEVSGFASRVDDYIAFAPELNPDGSIAFDVTIRGTWPRYGYQPVDATLCGGDGTLSLGPRSAVGLDLRGALVRARRRDTGAQLVGTPPDSLHAEIVGRPPEWGRLRDTELAVAIDAVARQSRVDPAADFAPAPDGRVLVGAGVRTTVVVREHFVRVGIEATNLLDTAYREYTSLLRYYADQPGRDVRVRLGMDF